MAEEESLVSRCRKAWEETWQSVFNILEEGHDLTDVVDDEQLIQAIRGGLTSSTKSYHYVLPTQLICKYVDHSLDACCLQAQRGGAGAFDARSIAHKVIVPFDKKYYNVLGGSPEPYVNHPLRVPAITLNPDIREHRKDKQGWDHLHTVLEAVEVACDPEFTKHVLKQVQIEIVRLLDEVHVVYPTPKRISLGRSNEIIKAFLSTPSGGDRPQAIATALFRTIGNRWGLFRQVRRAKTTAADAASGQIADLECVDGREDVVMAVEVKDTQLAIKHIEEKIPQIREKKVSEFFYLVKEGIEPDHVSQVKDRIIREFSSGHNIYNFDLLDFSEVVLALIGEEGRRDFLVEIGSVLDEYSSPISTRREWADLLSEV